MCSTESSVQYLPVKGGIECVPCRNLLVIVSKYLCKVTEHCDKAHFPQPTKETRGRTSSSSWTHFSGTHPLSTFAHSPISPRNSSPESKWRGMINENLFGLKKVSTTHGLVGVGGERGGGGGGVNTVFVRQKFAGNPNEIYRQVPRSFQQMGLEMDQVISEDELHRA